MTNIYQLPNDNDYLGEASDWLAKLDRGLTDPEQQSLREWLAADRRNPNSLMEVAKVWDKMDSLSRLADLFPDPASQRKRSPGHALAFAATVLLALLAGLWTMFGFYSTATDGEQAFQTAVGEQKTVHLPDGSQLTMNTNTLVRFAFTEHQRLLVLERGEVYLQVAQDRSRPLRVYADDKFVEAVGTAFNVKITENEKIELIVTEGKVLVGVIDRKATSAHALARNSAPPPSMPDSRVEVSFGEELLLGNSAEEVKKLKPEEIAVKLSWQGGNLIFRGEPLGKALAEIERYTPVEFIILDEDLKKKRVVGLFKAGDVDGLLVTLRQNFDIAYERVDDDKVILKNAASKQP